MNQGKLEVAKQEWQAISVYFCLENSMNSMKRQKGITLKDELPRSVGAQYTTGEEWRNNARKNEEMDPKQKQHLVVDVTGDGSKVRCCKAQYCIGTWNVRPMNQGKLEGDGRSEHQHFQFSSVQFSSVIQSCLTL